MHLVDWPLWILIACGIWPWWRAWQTSRRWSVFHAVHWGILSWLVWAAVIVCDGGNDAVIVALALSGCAGVAVLGARQPHVMAWNFVVLGLFCVMVLPLVEGWLIGAPSFDWLRVLFLWVTFVIGLTNYIPTRFGLAALAFGVGASLVSVFIAPKMIGGSPQIAHFLILATPLLAWMGWSDHPQAEPFDRLWLAFRDRLGVVWGLRVLEQFNASARNRGWPTKLTWFGFDHLDQATPEQRAEIGVVLDGLLKRFVD